MRISKIVCDGCGKEIDNNPIALFAERTNRENGDFTDGEPIWAPKKDFCGECLERIKYFVEKMGERTVAAEDIKPMATEEKAPEDPEAYKKAEEPKPPAQEPSQQKVYDCNKVHNSCRYAGKSASGDAICDHLALTGQRRGCPSNACTRYEKKTGGKK